MIINKLPVRTWNRLNMNETKLPEYSAESEECEWISSDEKFLPGEEMYKIFGDIETGMGNEMDKISKKIYIFADEDSEIDVPIVFDKDESLIASQIKIYAKKNAKVKLYQIQLSGENTTCFLDIGAVCEENAEFNLTKLELGAAKLYTGVHVSLKGDCSTFNSETGYIGKNKEHLDMNYVVRHIGKNTKSRMKVTGILKDGAFKLFRGSIDFLPGCAGAKGEETEEVLLLSDDVVNQTIPLILCGEEEVEGNHGASIGELDDKTLFYLAQRGIAKHQAEKMITKARIESISNKIPYPDIREKVSYTLNK